MATEDPSIAECDEVTESLELLDAVLLQFDEEKQTPPPPEEAARIISSLVGSPYQSLQRGQGTQTTLPRPSKKLSSQFGSLPFDLSAHAAPSAPPWLNKEAPRNHLHLPIKNPLTATVGQTSEDEQFSDDSLEGQVWSSDRDLSSGRDETVSRGEGPKVDDEDGKLSKSQSKSSIAWDIDWNGKKEDDKEKGKDAKGTYVIRERKRRAGLEAGLFNRPVIATSKSSGHLAKSVKLSRGRSLPSLTSEKPLENGIIVPISIESENSKAEPVLLNGNISATEDKLHSEKMESSNKLEATCVENEIDIAVREKNEIEEMQINGDDCSECVEAEAKAEVLSQECAITKIEHPEAEDVKDNSVDQCAIISTENQNGLLETEILVNGDVEKEEFKENFKPEKVEDTCFEHVKIEDACVEMREKIVEPVEVIEKELDEEVEKILEPVKIEEKVEEPVTMIENVVEVENKIEETEITNLEVEKAAEMVEIEENVVEPVTKEEEAIAELKSGAVQEEILVIESKLEEEPVSITEAEIIPDALGEEIFLVEVCNKLVSVLQEEKDDVSFDSWENGDALETEETQVSEKADVKSEDATKILLAEASAEEPAFMKEQACQVSEEVEPEKKINEDDVDEVSAPPLSEILDSGSEISEDEKTDEHPGPCEMSFKIMRPKVIRPTSMPPREENVVVYTTSVTLYPDAGLITYYDEKQKKEDGLKEGVNLLRPKSCSDISTGTFTCVDISLDDEPLSLDPITATEEASEAIDEEPEEVTEELDDEIKEEMMERVMDLPIKVDCLVQTEISGLSKRLCLESPGEQVVPSMAGFTPVENKSIELSLLADKKDEEEEEQGEEELPSIQRPVFFEPLNHRDNRRNHHGSQSEVNVPEQRRSAPESFLFPGSYTIPLSFAVTNKPPATPGSEGDEVDFAKERMEEKFKEAWEAKSREMKQEKMRARRVEEEKPVPPPHSIESRPKAKTPIEPEYRSVHKNRPPPLPPHQNLLELYSEPKTFPETFPPAPPPHMASSFPEQKPLPPTPLTPDRPLPPSPPRLPTSASFPVPPVARNSPNVTHRPLPSPPNTLKTRSVDASIGKGLRDQLKAQQGCTLPPDLSGATPRRHGMPTARKKHRAPAVPPHASLPETPVFSRGCDIPRAPYRALGIPVLRSSLSEEGAALCGPGRGWYPKQRRPAARSTENLEQAGWGEGGGGRKPHTLPPNMSPPKFFHRSSPREALRRVTSLLIRGRGVPAAPTKPKERKEAAPGPAAAASAASCETPQRQKRSFFRHFWKKSKHYSLEQ